MNRKRWEDTSPVWRAGHGETAPLGEVALPVGQNERRMQLRAYNMWAGMLGRRRFPAVADLCRGAMSGFAPHCVLLDFSVSMDSPAIAFFGEQLARECGVDPQPLQSLCEVTAGSLLGRLAGLYRQVLAVSAPTGFEAELTNPRGLPMAYRGILLPFSSDGNSADFVLAVINWKELADEETSRQIISEMNREVLGKRPPGEGTMPGSWADGPCVTCTGVPCTCERRTDARDGCTSHQQEQGARLLEPVAGGGCSISEALQPPRPPLPARVAEQLRMLPARDLAALPQGAEFSLILVRQGEGGLPAILGQIPHDPALLARAAERLLG